MLFKHEITKPCLQWALPSMCPYYSGLALIVLLYLNDTRIIDCISAEGKSQAVVCLCGANELADEPHILLHRRPLECCCSWLLSALLNKARWADRGWRVWSHHIHTHTHTIHRNAIYKVYTCLPTYVYIGGETAPSKVITVVHLSESEKRVVCCEC